MAWVLPAIGAATSIYSAVSQNRARKKTNEQEIELSNSAITRRMADARRAGVNPALAYMGTGANTPNLESPDFQALESVGRDVSSAYTQASQRSLIGLQKANMEAQNKLLEQQTAATAQQARKTAAEATLTESDIPYSAQSAKNRAEQVHYTLQETIKRIDNIIEDTSLKDADAQQRAKLYPLMIELQRTLNELEELKLPEAQAGATLYETTGATGKAAGMAKDLLNIWNQIRGK